MTFRILLWWTTLRWNETLTVYYLRVIYDQVVVGIISFELYRE